MNQNLCQNLTGLRRNKGITNTEISSITGISEERLFKIELGQEEATFEEIKVLADFYGKDVVDLYSGNLVAMHNAKAGQAQRGNAEKKEKIRKEYSKPRNNTTILVLAAILMVLMPIYAILSVTVFDVVGGIIAYVLSGLSVIILADSIIMATNARFTSGVYAKVSAIVRLVIGILFLVALLFMLISCIFATAQFEMLVTAFPPLALNRSSLWIKIVLLVALLILIIIESVAKIKAFKQTKRIQ